MGDDIYIGNTQKTHKKILDGHLSHILCLLQKGKKYDSYAAYLENPIKSTMSRTDLC